MDNARVKASLIGFDGSLKTEVDFAHSKLRIIVGSTSDDFIDVEIRHGHVMIRGGYSLIIAPEVSNAFYVKLARR